MTRPWLHRTLGVALVALCLLAGEVAPLQAQPAVVAQQFQRGNAAYERGEYAQALAAYQRVLNAGYTSAALHRNMGNVHVRRGAWGRAIQHYAKGLRLRPGDPALRHNLEQARARAGQTGPAPVLQSASVRFASIIPTRALVVLGTLLVLGGTGWAVGRTTPRRPEAWRAPRIVGVVGAGLFLWGLSLTVSALQVPNRYAVVLATEVPARRAPADTAAVADTLREGAVVEVEARRNGWTRARRPDGTPSWLPPETVGDV